MTTATKAIIGAVCVAAAIVITVRLCNSGTRTTGTPDAGSKASNAASSHSKQHASSNQDAQRAPSFSKPRPDDRERLRQVSDPAAVLSAHSTGDGESWESADDDLLVAWAASDTEAAMRWINGGERAVTRAQLLAAVAAGILIRDGADAMRDFLAKHQEDAGMRPKDQGELEKYLFFHLGREDTIEAAMGILREKQDPSLAGHMVLGIDGSEDKIKVIEYLEANGIAVATDYHAFQPVFADAPGLWADWANRRGSDWLDEIIESWARDNPVEARSWVDKQIPANDPRRPGIDEILDP